MGVSELVDWVAGWLPPAAASTSTLGKLASGRAAPAHGLARPPAAMPQPFARLVAAARPAPPKIHAGAAGPSYPPVHRAAALRRAPLAAAGRRAYRPLAVSAQSASPAAGLRYMKLSYLTEFSIAVVSYSSDTK